MQSICWKQKSWVTQLTTVFTCWSHRPIYHSSILLLLSWEVRRIQPIQCPRHSIISQDIVQCQSLASRRSNCTSWVSRFQSTPTWMVGFWIVHGSDFSGLIGSTWRRNNSAEGLSTLRMPWSGPYPAINICTKILLTSVVVLSTKWWQDVVTVIFLIIGFPLRSMDIGPHFIAKAWFWALKRDIVFLQQGAHNCQIYFWQRQRFIFNAE